MSHPLWWQVWLAVKKSTGDKFAIKSMRKEHLRESGQVLSAACVEPPRNFRDTSVAPPCNLFDPMCDPRAWQVASINVEHAILGKHNSEYLVRAYYSFRSAHHIYFALEFMPGGDLSSMLEQ